MEIQRFNNSQDLIHEVLALPNRMQLDNTPIQLEPTFRGNEYYDSSMYLKFNNAIKRMAEPREVEQTEIDVQSICRNEIGSVYAVAVHYPGGLVETDMLTKMRGTDKMSKDSGYGWSSYQTKFRFHPLFVSAYMGSIYGYKKVNDLQIAKELMTSLSILGKAMFYGNYCITICPGGFEIIRCSIPDKENLVVDGVSYPRPTEAIEFIPYEDINSENIEHLYSFVLRRYVSGEEYDVEDVLNLDLCRNIIELTILRLRKKIGSKGVEYLELLDKKMCEKAQAIASEIERESHEKE